MAVNVKARRTSLSLPTRPAERAGARADDNDEAVVAAEELKPFARWIRVEKAELWLRRGAALARLLKGR